MAEGQKMRGEKIYECDFNITGVTDYGVTLDALAFSARLDAAWVTVSVPLVVLTV